MVANPNKFQLMFLGTRKKTKLCLSIGDKTCVSSSSVTLLGVEIDWKLNFNQHVRNISNKANNKTKSLSRLRNKLYTNQKLSLYHSYILSAFGYCPLIWMFYGKSYNEGIDRVQRKALRIIYNDYNSDYDTLLKYGNHHKIHDVNNRKLLIEVYKCLNKLNPTFLNDLFKPKTLSHDLRNRNLLHIPNANTLNYGLKSLSYRGSMIWNSNNNSHLNQSKDLNQFKNRLKNQESIKCSCHLCF